MTNSPDARPATADSLGPTSGEGSVSLADSSYPKTSTRTHGSGQACYKQKLRPTCGECREYQRERHNRRYKDPTSYRYIRAHSQAAFDARRYQKRRKAIAQSEAELKGMVWQS